MVSKKILKYQQDIEMKIKNVYVQRGGWEHMFKG
jgi:hypothetical protein